MRASIVRRSLPRSVCLRIPCVYAIVHAADLAFARIRRHRPNVKTLCRPLARAGTYRAEVARRSPCAARRNMDSRDRGGCNAHAFLVVLVIARTNQRPVPIRRLSGWYYTGICPRVGALPCSHIAWRPRLCPHRPAYRLEPYDTLCTQRASNRCIAHA